MPPLAVYILVFWPFAADTEPTSFSLLPASVCSVLHFSELACLFHFTTLDAVRVSFLSIFKYTSIADYMLQSDSLKVQIRDVVEQ